MRYRDLRWAIALAVFSALALGGCQSAEQALVARIDAALAKSGRYLVERQSPDGAWRSDVYGLMKDGPSLTPYVMSALYFMPQAGPKSADSYRKGVDYLAGFVGPDGKLKVAEKELLFPTYTAAMASRMVRLMDPTPRNLAAQQAYLAYLRDRQLDEHLRWSKDDPPYGGWGFAQALHRKPRPREGRAPTIESNLTSTLFALAAMKSAKVPANDPAWARALTFVRRCQNFPDENAPPPAIPVPGVGMPPIAAPTYAFDDGGFFFMPDDPGMNKAGIVGRELNGRARYHSYGSMTADGLRALLLCGLPAKHPRVQAAQHWLEQNFDARQNPGVFERDREVLRDATYYYWAWSAAHAFATLHAREIQTRRGRVDWAVALAEELLYRQADDGTWANRYTDAKEDDPLIATPWAAATLAICRAALLNQPFGQATTLSR